MNEASALIFDIEKFAVHDGPGIRTVVFMKGCPLHCIWCHNPESQSFRPEILFSDERCTGCGKCVAVCPQHCHRLENGVHRFRRRDCTGCGKCAETCLAGALELAGKRMTVPEVLAEVLKDKPFYDHSGGGITLSGGEPMAHFDFTKALLEAAVGNGLHTAVETSGFAEKEKFRALLPLVDCWLWDVKAAPALHEKLIGTDSKRILSNLQMLSEAGARIVLRCPLVPGVNDSEEALLQIAELANTLKGVQEIDLEPYHPLGEGKNRKLGKTEYFHSDFAGRTDIETYETFLKKRTKIRISHP